tara:strand:+ start:1010 stop:1480 length:471 start_codon:yes stop_codon:yes gene_type:complete
MKHKVAYLIGSTSDQKFAEASIEYFNFFDIESSIMVMSAHRNPEVVKSFASTAKKNGYGVLVCGAGMAAHLAGAVKSVSTLPVIGVPFPGGMMDGMDSLLSTVQMPKGVPVATMSIGKAGSINAAILCAEIFAINDHIISGKLDIFKKNGSTLIGL